MRNVGFPIFRQTTRIRPGRVRIHDEAWPFYPAIHFTSRMTPSPILTALFTLGATATISSAAITPYAEYHLGEAGASANNLPVDTSGNGRDFVTSISGGNATIGNASFHPQAAYSTAYIDTGGGGNEGWYSTGLFTSLPTDNFAFGVFARAAANTSGTQGDVFTLGGLNGAFKISLAPNGWAASAHNVAWIAATDGIAGSFIADTWVHLALVRSGGITTFYINGTAQGTTHSGAPVHNTPHLSVNPGGSTYFDGQIDEARVVTFDAGAATADILTALVTPAAPPAPEPVIVTQPAPALVPAGSNATFSVGVTGATPLTYQWYRFPGPVEIDGATAATLTLTNVTAVDATSFQVVVTNTHGTVTSNPATLTLLVSPAPATVPSATQQAQIDRKYGMFCHFGVNTFVNQEWTDGSIPATAFAPTAVDADQWVQTAKAAGMRYLLLTTKHHDGFCLWDSQWTTYDVASSSVPQLDVVKVVSEACARHGMRFAIYYSLWDRHEPSYSDPVAYLTYMKRQLTELLTNYGPVSELWFDGGWDRAAGSWGIPEIYHLVKTLQPECQMSVNWTIGTDAGTLHPADQQPGDPFRYFPADFRTGDPDLPKFVDPKTFTHDGLTYYLPYEATVTIAANSHWFFNTGDTQTKSLATLERAFNVATAQNNLLVFNAAPNRDGVLLPSNVSALTQLAHRLGLEPDRPHPVNLALTATATASSTWAAAGYEAPNACDENPDSRWSAAAGDLSPTLEIDFGTPTRFDRVIVNEYGEGNAYRCTSFVLESGEGETWTTLHTGTTLGESIRIDLTTAVTSRKLRLRILSSTSPVSIWNVKVQDSARPNPAQSSYQLWQHQNFSLEEIEAGLAGKDQAPAADGVANALKFALGIEAVRLPYTGASLTPLAVGPDDTHIFTFQRARRDAIYSVEASQDLVDWSTIATNPGTVGSLAEVPFPDPLSGRSFVRLRVLADQ